MMPNIIRAPVSLSIRDEMSSIPDEATPGVSKELWNDEKY